MPHANQEALSVVRLAHDTLRVLVHDSVAAPDSRALVEHAGLLGRLWGGLPEWITAVGTVALVIVGWMALKTWQHEFRLKVEYRLAHRVYVAVLRLRDRIETTRGGFHMLWLSKEESQDEKRVLQLHFEQYEKLFRDVVRADLALMSLRPEVELHWGTEGTQYLDSLDERARQLRGGFHAYFHHSFKALEDAAYAQYAASDRRTAYQPLDTEVDEYGVELTKRVDAATAFLRSKLTLTVARRRSARA